VNGHSRKFAIVVISTLNLSKTRLLLALRATDVGHRQKLPLNIDIAVCPQLVLEAGDLTFAEHGHATIV